MHRLISLLILSASLILVGGNPNVSLAQDRAKEASMRAAQDYLKHGLILAGEGRYDNAVESFRKALAINPNWPEALSLLGSALNKVGNDREAEEALRKAVALKPDYGEGWYHLGEFLEERGKKPEAQEAFRKAKQFAK
ncbi:MAG: tetratricopeptide repeat protein [Deltaproteobacteria bacterium]|nr:tetratricopeptide repeat protein [Deltaproteobacteria bacterium]